MVKLFSRIKEKNGVCMMNHKYILMSHFRFGRYVNIVISNVYQVRDVISNDLDATLSSIGFVQLHEPSSPSMYLA